MKREEARQRGFDAISALQNDSSKQGVPLVIALGGQEVSLGLEGWANNELTPFSYAQMLSILRKKMETGESIHGVAARADDIELLKTQAEGAAEAFIPERGAFWQNARTKLFFKKAIDKK